MKLPVLFPLFFWYIAAPAAESAGKLFPLLLHHLRIDKVWPLDPSPPRVLGIYADGAQIDRGAFSFSFFFCNRLECGVRSWTPVVPSPVGCACPRYTVESDLFPFLRALAGIRISIFPPSHSSPLGQSLPLLGFRYR